jgi:hypothetical protein
MKRTDCISNRDAYKSEYKWLNFLGLFNKTFLNCIPFYSVIGNGNELASSPVLLYVPFPSLCVCRITFDRLLM